MDAWGVLCHLEVHPLIPAINWTAVDASSNAAPTVDKADLPRLFFVRVLPRCPVDVLVHCAPSAVPVYCLNDEVEQVPVSQSITCSCFGQGPVDTDGLM